MPLVRVRENEPFDIALRRFKRNCEKAGIVTETRRREYHEKATTERKRSMAAAKKRLAKRLMKEQPMPLRGKKGAKKSTRRSKD